jgi:beta-lactam-binding protein with PASTA domain
LLLSVFSLSLHGKNNLSMKAKEFFGKFLSAYLWGNLLAMALVVVGLCFGVKYGLELYTHHGEGIEVPKLVNMTSKNARLLLAENGLELQVNDSGYNKRLPADCILAQSPGAGMKVKPGHIIYVTVNSPSSPSFAIPDIIDNSSYREAEAKLQAIGFKLLPPKRIIGERDWVYGILCRGRRLNTGEHVSIDSPLTLLIGNGQYGEDDDIDYTEPEYYYEEDEDEIGAYDEFEEVKETVPTEQQKEETEDY